MRKVPDRKIMRSICKYQKKKHGKIYWNKVAIDLLKLKTYQNLLQELKEKR